ncbi:type II toxin-antitoxin system Phd/YefM family antitoxin [Paraclostridium bifermentans]|uniref:type II toxin-antitoxin system Phd/YefM family antitoxin n=1 Tax=Paraclostridium bifermentans TaxID=1490 RepID=UPI0018AC365C|nr:type II toxin-antitoxin system Phd/YefM family antitoxin [Paraclostridium bifermentans]
MRKLWKNNMVSASDVSKNFGKVSKQVKDESYILVIKNNKPDTVLMDFEYFNNIMDTLNHLEDQQLLELIEERKPQMNQKGFSLDDLRKRNKERKESSAKSLFIE